MSVNMNWTVTVLLRKQELLEQWAWGREHSPLLTPVQPGAVPLPAVPVIGHASVSISNYKWYIQSTLLHLM